VDQLDYAMRIDVYSHYVKATKFDTLGKTALFEFAIAQGIRGWKPIGRGKSIQCITSIFAAATKDRSEFRFHINHFEALKRHLTAYDIGPNKIQIVEHEGYTPAIANFVKISTKNLFDYQVPLHEYFIADGKTKVVTLQTGKGKTMLFLESVYKLQKRVILIIRPKYIDKWILDFREMFKETDTSLAVIRGGGALSNMLQACIDGTFDVDFTIMSNKTYQLWVKDYEHTRGQSGDYPLNPDMLCEATKAGVIAVDEVHNDFHLNFKMDLYTHGAKSMNMSATLVNGNPKITEMYQVKFPKLERSPEIEYDKYIAVTALSYTLISQKGMRFKRSMGYSHTAYEESIMKDKERLRNYLTMIAGITKTTFINRMVPGKKMLIFASTVEMCTLIVKFITPMFPDQKVNRYVGEDDYADLHTADIVVSTIQSAGTAVDVDGLWVVLMTDSIDSIQSNLQVLGRLRKMKGEFLGVTPEFYYIFCNQIEKQVQYHMNKLEHFSGRVIGHRTLLTSYKV